MAHYFDDVFTRHIAGPPKQQRQHIRRSSTNRSMGARSDFDTSVNGDHEDDTRSVGNSVAPESPERHRERQEANTHMANYVSEQLERVKSHESFDNADEFEASLDEN